MGMEKCRIVTREKRLLKPGGKKRVARDKKASKRVKTLLSTGSKKRIRLVFRGVWTGRAVLEGKEKEGAGAVSLAK